MKAVRSFIAIECPVKIKEEIQKFQQELKMAMQTAQGPPQIKSEDQVLPVRARGVGASEKRSPHGPPQINWTRSEGFHLTLKFLGNVGEDRISEIVHAIRGVTETFLFFVVSVGDVGVFPHTRSPRVIWIGVKSVGDDLVRLQGGIEKVLGPLGFPPEDRPFHPHLTLGRIKSDDRRSGLRFDNAALAQWLLENQKRDCGRFAAKEVLLMRSDLQAGGAVYTPLAKLRLAVQSEARQSEPLA
jgi:2'-5' RNA ligase